MAGLVPATHVEKLDAVASGKCGGGPTWVPGTSPGMTEKGKPTGNTTVKCVNAVGRGGRVYSDGLPTAAQFHPVGPDRKDAVTN
jgi:hypothetical protein